MTRKLVIIIFIEKKCLKKLCYKLYVDREFDTGFLNRVLKLLRKGKKLKLTS